MVLFKPGVMDRFYGVGLFGSGVNGLSWTKGWLSLVSSAKQLGMVWFGPQLV
jgi:hypothetical protein